MKGSRVAQNVFTEIQRKKEYIMRNFSSEDKINKSQIEFQEHSISPSLKVSINLQNKSLEVVELRKENFTEQKYKGKVIETITELRKPRFNPLQKDIIDVLLGVIRKCKAGIFTIYNKKKNETQHYRLYLVLERDMILFHRL